PYAVIAFPRILTSAIKILGDNRFLLSTDREAAPYTNIRHAIPMRPFDRLRRAFENILARCAQVLRESDRK
ncbi:hypothetical protein, partial [Ellagibacter isourolithinifaciens]|uniref:hypothetical protein n=1 Tax=Ellagibacter isourolithinifaciens TaxID=2137581 RepID=UPI001B87D6D7